MAAVRLLRHATLLVELGGRTLLVDPMLAEQGTMDPVPDVPDDRPNPLVPLPEFDPTTVDADVVTHLHRDHLDDAAVEGLPADLPLFCQPLDADELATRGFTGVRAVEATEEWGDLTIERTDARHGTGEVAERMGPAAGFLLSDEETTVYLTGDTVWYEAVERVIERRDPDAVVVNAGEARFAEGGPITMTREGVASLARTTDAPVLAVHMEAWNHCRLAREDLRAYLDREAPEVADRVALPADGERVEL